MCAEQKGVTGHCRLKKKPRWTYNKYTGKCEKFLFHGCGGKGNRNNFKSKKKCNKKCGKGKQNTMQWYLVNFHHI